MEESKPYYPDDWQDDQSMDVLFSPFRDNREVNPHSWDRKLKFWTEMVFHECRYVKSCVIDVKTLPHKFIRKGKVPVCLNTVLADLYRHGKIQKISDFHTSINQGWMSWGFGTFVKKPLSWTYGKVFGLDNGPIDDGPFVVTDMLKEQSEVVLECHYSVATNDTTDHLIEYNTLWHQVEDICPDQMSFDLVLMQLVKDKKITIADTSSERKEKVIRFAQVNKKSAAPISDLELRILRLQKAEAYLQGQVLKLSEEMERCRSDAKFYLSKGLRNSAKNALRRKQTLGRILEKREGALETIHDLVQRIKDAESDKVIIDAYAAGTAAFKDIAKANGLNIDTIDDVMTDVQEVFDMQSEINASISQGPTDPALDITTADLETELESILATDKETESEPLSTGFKSLNISDPELPSAPTFDPATPPRLSPTRHQSHSHQRISPKTAGQLPSFS